MRMSEQDVIQRIAQWGPAVAGTLLCTAAIALVVREASNRQTLANAEVLRVLEPVTGPTSRGYVPIVRFRDSQGAEHTTKLPPATAASAYATGDRLLVRYDAADPGAAVAADFYERFGLAILLGSLGALLLLFLALMRRHGGEAPVAPKGKRSDAGAVDGFDMPRLQFHPLNTVALSHYLQDLEREPGASRKVKVTEASAAIGEGRVPVVVCEHLAWVLAVASDQDAATALKVRVPQAKFVQSLEAGAVRALAYAFEDALFLVFSPARPSFLSRAVAPFPRSAGRRDYLPPEAVWDAVPRQRAAAASWDSLRGAVDGWLAEAGKAAGPAPSFFIAGAGTASALADVAAYEFVKRGRSVAALVTFGGSPGGGQLLADDFERMGLDERCLRVEAHGDRSRRFAVSRAPRFGTTWRLPEPAGGGQTSPSGIEPRYAQSISALVERRFRELLAPGGGDKELAECAAAIARHKAYIGAQSPAKPAATAATTAAEMSIPA